MKEAFDREMDSLLRRRARGTAEPRPWGDVWGEDPTATHLDADELGAFAEGALPAAARLAAASHLADCDRCRGVVVGLASVAPAGAEVEQRAAAATPSAAPARVPAWRALIASLFAPRAMRFAVPVLALSLVGVVSYVALRSDRGAAVQVARDGGRRPGTQSEQPNASAPSNTAGANDNPAGLMEANTNAVSTATTATTAPPPAPRGGHGGTVEHPVVVDGSDSSVEGAQPAPPPAPPAAASAEGPAEMSKAAPKPVTTEEGEAARADNNKEKSENRDKPARAPEPMDEIASGDLSTQQRNSRARVNEVQMPDGGAPRNQQRRGTDNNTQSGVGSGSGTGPAPRESASGRAGSRSEPARRARAIRESERKADEDDVVRVGETRSAAGHRFRREGNAWVDVNYKPSMRSTGVRRGTESYRALVADAPEVGRVAEALSGEVIVVVGGRAYHIR